MTFKKLWEHTIKYGDSYKVRVSAYDRRTLLKHLRAVLSITNDRIFKRKKKCTCMSKITVMPHDLECEAYKQTTTLDC